MFSTSTDGRVMWWDIRKLGEPVETLQLEFAGYRPGQKLGGITLEYESTMVRMYNLIWLVYIILAAFFPFSQPNSWLEPSKVLYFCATAKGKLLQTK